MRFSVSILHKSVDSPSDEKEPLWLESIRLLEAPSEKDAEALAKEIAQRDEHSYTVESGATVTWKFMSIESVFAVESDNLTTGIEVFSRFLRASEAESLLKAFDDE